MFVLPELLGPQISIRKTSAGIGDLACSYSLKNLGHNLESSFFLFLYIHAGNMSVKKWHQLAEEKWAVDQQTQEIHKIFRMDKINKEFSQLSGEELFTKRV